MAIDDNDVYLFASRIRPHFPPELRETAFDLAHAIARFAGVKAKELRPETTLDEILGWMKLEWPEPKDSLDSVEWIMALEEELGEGFTLPDDLAGRTDTATFAELVESAARRRHKRKRHP
jgi:acyl carrier protein